MKKQKLKHLSLNKKVVSNLNDENIKGGRFSQGCTDGCTDPDGFTYFLCTMWNCTRGNCTEDCGTNNICNSFSCPDDQVGLG